LVELVDYIAAVMRRILVIVEISFLLASNWLTTSAAEPFNKVSGSVSWPHERKILLTKAECKKNQKSQTAEFKRIKAKLKTAQMELERYKQLFQAGAIAQSQYDYRRSQLNQLEQQLAAVNTDLVVINKLCRGKLRY
jgi:hypothetical protein